MNYKLLIGFFGLFLLWTNCENTTKEPIAVLEKSLPKMINFIKKVDISGDVQLAFVKYDSISELYYEPFLIVNQINFRIKGFDNKNRSRGEILALSPNGKYFIMDYLSMTYVDEKGDKVEKEAVFCIVIDIQNKNIIHQMKSDCEGEWNSENQWISNGKVIVTLD